MTTTAASSTTGAMIVTSPRDPSHPEENRPVNRRTVVLVSAGLGQPSSTRLLGDRLTEAVVGTLAEQGEGVDVEVVELREHAHAIVDAMLTGFATGELADAIERVTQADALVLVTPVFTTSYSGLFKSFLDILDKDSLTGMPVLLGATGGTARHSLALEYAMRPLLTYLRADVATTSVFAATDDWADASDGGAALPARIARAGRELARTVAARPVRAAAAGSPGASPAPFAGTPSFEELLGGLGA